MYNCTNPFKKITSAENCSSEPDSDFLEKKALRMNIIFKDNIILLEKGRRRGQKYKIKRILVVFTLPDSSISKILQLQYIIILKM